MSAKEYLQQAYKLEARINANIEQVERLRELATKATATITAVRVSGTNSHSKVEDCVCKVIDLQEEIKENIAALVEVKRDIQQTIASVEDKSLNILLTLRYLNYNTWEEIAQKLYYSDRWVHKLHSDALAVVAGIINSA
jgi:DNA-directed RNA polymerase specialized sigma subunit